MKTATVADIRNHFSDIAKWIEEGESVTITKRGKPFAKLTAPDKPLVPPLVNWMDRLHELNPNGINRGDSLDILAYDREEG